MDLESLNAAFVIGPDAGRRLPLAVPYLLNPAGIVVLVTASAETRSLAVFRWAVQVSNRLDPGRMLVTEKVFGFLLAALAVQLGTGAACRRANPPEAGQPIARVPRRPGPAGHALRHSPA